MPGERVRCRINVRSAYTGIPGQSSPVKHGVSEVIVHEDDLPQLRRMVETMPEAWAQAETITRRKTLAHIAEDTGEDLDEIIATPSDEWPDAWTEAADRYVGSSPGGEFRNLTGHDHLSLLSVEELERLPGEVGRDMALASQVAQGIIGNAGNAALEAQVAALTAQVAALIEAATAPPTPPEAKTRRGK